MSRCSRLRNGVGGTSSGWNNLVGKRRTSMSPIAHGGMNPRATEKLKAAAKELESIRISEAENGGHLAEHHFASFEHPPEQHVFSAPGEGMAKPVLPEGHILHHIAKEMHIPHTVMGAKEESAKEANGKAHEPDEDDELERE